MKRNSSAISSSQRLDSRTSLVGAMPSSSNSITAQQQARTPSIPLSQLISSLRDKTIIIKDETNHNDSGEGCFTIESQQMSRKHRLLSQLKIARRIRAVLEQAADKAEASTCEETKDIIIEHKSVINELVALTQANRGNYTLDSYNIYSDIYERRERKFSKQVKKAKKIVRNHLKDLAKESNPDFIEIQEEEEKEESLEESEVEIVIEEEEVSEEVSELAENSMNTSILQDSSENDDEELDPSIVLNHLDDLDEEEETSNSISQKGSDEFDESYVDEDDQTNDDMEETYEPSPSPPQRSSRPFTLRTASRKGRRSSKSETRYSSASSKKTRKISVSSNSKDIGKGPPAIRKRTLKSGRQVSPTTRSTMYEEQKRKNVRKKKPKKLYDNIKTKSSSSIASVASAETATKETTEIALETASSTASVTSATNNSINAKSNKSTKATKPAPMRKCHYCKKTSSTYLRCHFFFVNGNKCGKVFCHSCLTGKYGYSQEKYDNCVGDNEWHCPSCLGKCECVACVRNRAWTERQANSLNRRSKTRASVESAYIY